jgi:hypothetical protein
MFKPIALFYADGYKVSHKKMLAKGTAKLYGTWIPRSLKYAPKGVKKILSAGHQLTMRWLHANSNQICQNILVWITMGLISKPYTI